MNKGKAIDRISTDRLKKIYETYERVGSSECARLTGLSKSTVERYCTLYRSRMKDEPQQPKILIFDIETAPIKALVWGVFKQFIQPKFMLNDWFIMTWAAKWLGSDEILSDRLTPDEAVTQDDKRICVSLWDLFDEADILVAYNGKKFDIKRAKTRFIIHKLLPPSSFILIDPYITVKNDFAFTRNTMDEVNRQLGLPRKIETDGQLWLDAYFGNEDALVEMERYNIGDIEALEANYLRLRPYINSHPNVALYNNSTEMQCHRCGSTDLTPDGYYLTGVSKFLNYRCSQCGGLTRGRTNNLSSVKMKQLGTGVAR